MALGLAAVVVAWTSDAAPPPSRPAARALAVSLVAYLLLGACAVAAPASLSAGLWSSGWVPITALLSAIGLLAAEQRRATASLLVLTGAVTVAGAVLVRPSPSFEGVAAVAPDAVTTPWPAVVEAGLLGWGVALLVSTVLAFHLARRASILDRHRLARAAAVTSTGPCLVLACLALAVLRDPGDVDVGTGSVAYTVTIALLAVVAVWAVATDRPATVRLVAGAWAGGVVVVGGVALTGPVLDRHLTVGVLGVVATTVAVAATTVVAVLRFERWSRPPAPRPVARTLPGLSPRENDVLAVVATGATNAAVGETLFLSERTVEQHLRSIFTKLDLGDHGGSNRRVRAAALWWEQQRLDVAETDAG